MTSIIIILGIILLIFIFFAVLIFMLYRRDNRRDKKLLEIGSENIEVLATYVAAQKEQQETERAQKELKQAEQKQKLETFKQTKEQLKEKLKSQIDAKAWKPLETILKSADKGGVGIYVMYNETKNKFYVGQAKQLHKRIRDHFVVEDITRDYLAGDKIRVKMLTANELDADYRLDHIEKTGIEIFNSDKNGYNKTGGNM